MISTNAYAALVEWQEGGRTVRGYVPAERVVDGRVDVETLGANAPYGLDFSKLPKSLSLRDLEQRLHDAQVWTREDLFERFTAVRRIVAGYTNEIVRAIIDCGR